MNMFAWQGLPGPLLLLLLLLVLIRQISILPVTGKRLLRRAPAGPASPCQCWRGHCVPLPALAGDGSRPGDSSGGSWASWHGDTGALAGCLPGQSTEGDDGRCCQTPGTPPWAATGPCPAQSPQAGTEHPEVLTMMCGPEQEHLKTFPSSGLIPLALGSSHRHFPVHRHHLLLLKLDKYFLSPTVSPLPSSSS